MPSDANDSEGGFAYTSFAGVAFQEDWYYPEGLGPGDYLIFVAAPEGVTCRDPQSISVHPSETVTVDIACARDSTTGPSGEGNWDY